MNIHEGNGYAKYATYITVSWSTFVVMSSTISEKIKEDNKVLKRSPGTESQELTSPYYKDLLCQDDPRRNIWVKFMKIASRVQEIWSRHKLKG